MKVTIKLTLILVAQWIYACARKRYLSFLWTILIVASFYIWLAPSLDAPAPITYTQHDPDSYYYLNLDHYPQSLPISDTALLKDNAINQFLNSTLMYLEVERTKKTIGETKSVKKYLNTKAAVQENPDIMDNIVVPQRAPDLMDFLGNLET